MNLNVRSTDFALSTRASMAGGRCRGGRVFRAVVGIGLALGMAAASRAEHARIDMRLSSNGETVTANVDVEPPAGGRNEPPVLKVKAGDPLVLQFILTNIYPHRTIENVEVRYYVVRVAKLGRQPAPSWPEDAANGNDAANDEEATPILQEGVVAKGQFKMEFKPDCRVGTRMKLRVAKPGIYIARVETRNTQSDHEHFSAINLVVE